MIASCISNLSDFRMSLFDSSSSEAELSKLHTADHNMNSSASTEGKHSAFPFPAFPQFPFLPIPGLSQESLPTVPLSLNLTGQLEEASPKSAESESPKSSPTGNIDIYILWQHFYKIVVADMYLAQKFTYSRWICLKILICIQVISCHPRWDRFWKLLTSEIPKIRGQKFAIFEPK